MAFPCCYHLWVFKLERDLPFSVRFSVCPADGKIIQKRAGLLMGFHERANFRLREKKRGSYQWWWWFDRSGLIASRFAFRIDLAPSSRCDNAFREELKVFSTRFLLRTSSVLARGNSGITVIISSSKTAVNYVKSRGSHFIGSVLFFSEIVNNARIFRTNARRVILSGVIFGKGRRKCSQIIFGHWKIAGLLFGVVLILAFPRNIHPFLVRDGFVSSAVNQGIESGISAG